MEMTSAFSSDPHSLFFYVRTLFWITILTTESNAEYSQTIVAETRSVATRQDRCRAAAFFCHARQEQE